MSQEETQKCEQDVTEVSAETLEQVAAGHAKPPAPAYQPYADYIPGRSGW